MFLLRTTLTLAATAVVMVTVLLFGARWWWVLDLAASFRFQYFILAIVLSLLFAALRRPRWCIALALCAAANFVPLIDYLPRPEHSEAASASGSSAVRLMTVNLSQLDYGVEPLLSIVRGEAPDVLLLVEFSRVWDERLREVDALYPHRLKIPAADAYGMALLSRHELGSVQQIMLEGTPAIEARVLAPSGGFKLLGVHLRSPMTRGRWLERNRQLQVLEEFGANAAEPLVVIGDFNVTPYSPFVAAWLAATGLRDTGTARGPRFSWPTFLPILGVPIDHCIVSEEFEVIAQRRSPAFGSDHYAVTAELVLQ